MIQLYTKQFVCFFVLIVFVQVYLYKLILQESNSNLSTKSASDKVPNCDLEDTNKEVIDELTPYCKDPFDYRAGRQFYQRGKYTILANYIQASESVPYKETITIATHATVDFLQYLEPLVYYWPGPISVAVFAPGTDFGRTMAIIAFLRNCIPNGPKIKARVTFHIIFPSSSSNLPAVDPGENLFEMSLPDVNCKDGAPNSTDYRAKKKVLFPINLARNVAREGATTYFVLVNDIELFPQPADFISKFFKLIERMEKATPGFLSEPQVFVLPPFEVKAIVGMEGIPRNKSMLLEMINNTLAYKFHKFACDVCHRLPHRLEWNDFLPANTSLINELNIFYTSKYISKFAWEPFYIGTHADPPFDERIYREHALNKVVQANALCHLGYKFHVLDSGFLVHRPGLKFGSTFRNYMKRYGMEIIRSKVRPLQKVLYGQRKNCF